MKLAMKYKIDDNGIYFFFPSSYLRQKIAKIAEGNEILVCEIKKNYKSRSNQQNRMFWALVTLIANETGEDIQTVENDLKVKSISKGYPYKVSTLTGYPIPSSTTQVDTKEMSCLLDTCFEVCSFLGIQIPTDWEK